MLKQGDSTQAIKRSSRERLISISLLLIASIAALSVCARVWLARASEARPRPPAMWQQPVNPPQVPATSTQQIPANARRVPVQVARFTVYDVGLYPRELHVSRGLIRLSIEDVSGGTPGVEVARETSNAQTVSAGQIRRAEQSHRGQTDLQLEPGHYAVFDTRYPDNKAELIVEP